MLRLGIDVGGTKINVGLIRFDGGAAQVLAQRRLAVKDLIDAVAEISNAALELCKASKVAFTDISGCGVGIPGTVSADGMQILKAPNITALGKNFASRLAAALGIPVRLVQDSRAAAWGEYRCGGVYGAHSVICFTLGTGIGTGLVLNGQIYHGALGTAGELGHIPIAENGRPCGCGKRGCLEKYCAGGGLDITAAELLGQGNTAKDLFAAAKAGNSAAQSAINAAVTHLGNAIVAAVNLLSPDCVLFSGGLAEEEAYLTPLMDYVRDHCYATDALPVLKKAKLGALAPMIGAAVLDA
jgi:glucokinase